MDNKIVAISGYFQILHVGHIDYILAAKKLGNYLIVIINSDEQAKLKKTPSIISEECRRYIISNIKGVDETIIAIDTDESVAKTLELIKPHIFCNSGDRTLETSSTKEADICNKLGIEQVFISQEKKESSSGILLRAHKILSQKTYE